MTLTVLFNMWLLLLILMVVILAFRHQISRIYWAYNFKKKYAAQWKKQGGKPQRKPVHTCDTNRTFKVTMPNGEWHYHCIDCNGTLTPREYDALNLVRRGGIQ